MISVVIPYFQRERGILGRALQSVFASEGIDWLEIIVVDDASPIPAREEIAAIGSTRFPVTVIEQANSGPGGARNSGLDRVHPNTEYVAFLDSDDEWMPRHLHNAMTALQAGYDIYFSDLLQLGAEVSAFRRAGRIDPSLHRTIAGRDDLHEYEGDMVDQIITGNVIGTPTVVYSVHKFPDVRFQVDLTAAGEDYLFWLDLASREAKFAFGSETAVVCGKGVNVYAGSGWGTEGHARRVADELAFRKTLLRRYRLTTDQQRIVVSQIRTLGEVFVKDCLHRAAHRKPIDWKLVRSTLGRHPSIMTRVLPVFGEMGVNSLRRLMRDKSGRPVP